MSKEDQAVELFLNKYSCSQSVFIAFCEPEVLDQQAAMKISTIFGSGMCSTGTGLCGAASGALLAISMKHGMNDVTATEAKAKTYALGQSFLTEFKERMRAYTCEEVLGVNVNLPEYKQNAQELRSTRCVHAVRMASQILEELL